MPHSLDKTPNPQIVMDLGAVGGGIFLKLHAFLKSLDPKL